MLIYQFLVTDEKEIKRITADHFQNCAGSINKEKEISESWKQEYLPKENISDDIYIEVTNPIIIEEILETAKLLPKGKATRTTEITYEDIILMIEPLKEFIQQMFNKILEIGC